MGRKLDICEQWCGRRQAPDGCLCLGKLRALLEDLERPRPRPPEEAARAAVLAQRLREILSGRFDPRTAWPRSGDMTLP